MVAVRRAAHPRSCVPKHALTAERSQTNALRPLRGRSWSFVVGSWLSRGRRMVTRGMLHDAAFTLAPSVPAPRSGIDAGGIPDGIRGS